jgi:hypothetical protein
LRCQQLQETEQSRPSGQPYLNTADGLDGHRGLANRFPASGCQQRGDATARRPIRGSAVGDKLNKLTRDELARAVVSGVSYSFAVA